MKTINPNEIEAGKFYAVISAQIFKGFVNEIIQVVSVDAPFMAVKCKTGVCGITQERKPVLTKLDEFELAEPSPEFLAILIEDEFPEVIL